MQDFRNLKVWEKSHNLSLRLYGITKTFPKEELYGLTSQLRRSVISIPTNIAEGCGRFAHKETAHFMQIAFGSASETEYLILLAKDLNFLSVEEYNYLDSEIEEVKKMLSTLIKKIRTDKN